LPRFTELRSLHIVFVSVTFYDTDDQSINHAAADAP